MRIGIDARKLHDFGIGTYIRNLLQELARMDHETDFVILSRPDDSVAVTTLGENFRVVKETAALRPPAARAMPVGGHDPRLHSPDVSAVPAQPLGARLRAHVDHDGGEAVDPGADRL